MENNIWLQWQLNDNDYQDLLAMYNDEKIASTISNLRQRAIASPYIALIKKGNESIGFIHLTRESKLKDMLCVDMGIVEKYRNFGYSKIALQLLKKAIAKDEELSQISIISETKISNLPANNGICKKIYTTNDTNFYSLGPASKDEEAVQKIKLMLQNNK